MNDTTMYQTTDDMANWRRAVDMTIILIIGILLGATVCYGAVMYSSEHVSRLIPTTTTTTPAGQTITLPAGARIDNA